MAPELAELSKLGFYNRQRTSFVCAFVLTICTIETVVSQGATFRDRIYPTQVTLDKANVTCGDVEGMEPFIHWDGSLRRCGVQCPQDRRRFDPSLAYEDVLAGHTLADMGKPSSSAPGRGYDSSVHRQQLVTRDVYIRSADFTVSFWIYVNYTYQQIVPIQLSASPLLTIQVYIPKKGDNYGMFLYVSSRTHGTGYIAESSWIFPPKKWTHFTFQITAISFNMFIDGSFKWPSSLLNDTTDLNAAINNSRFRINIGLYNPSNVSVLVQDFRIYNHTLTNREIFWLFTGNTTVFSGPGGDCLCPATAPAIGVSDSGEQCANNGDFHSKISVNIPRLNTNVHPVRLATDGNPNTFWLSRSNYSDITITLHLRQKYEVGSVSVHFKSKFPKTLTLSGDKDNNNVVLKQYKPSIWYSNYVTFLHPNTTLVTSSISLRMSGFESSRKEMQYYAISHIPIHGRCFCNGRSSQCDRKNALICSDCKNSYGVSCETCSPGFYSDEKKNNTCQNCDCNAAGINQPDLKDYCLQTNVSSETASFNGQCTCKRFVTGRRCDVCFPGYYNLTSSNPDGCVACNCSREGALTGNCDPTTGQCMCKKNVMGRKCDQCKPLFCAMSSSYPEGCITCGCFANGTLSVSYLENKKVCTCKKFVSGDFCHICKPGYYGLSAENPDGCQPCQCDRHGIVESDRELATCEQQTGKCQCKPFVTSWRCDSCIDGYYWASGLRQEPPGCNPCSCYAGGTQNGTFCDKTTGQCVCRPTPDVAAAGRHCTPYITSVVPNFGPRAGGTPVVIRGGYLGSSPNVSIGGMPCKIINSNDSHIICSTLSLNQTTLVEKPLSVEVILHDEFTPRVTEQFTYKEDPSIASVHPLETIPSGGIVLTVSGDNFESVYIPLMNISLYHNDKLVDNHLTRCNVSNNSILLCETPELKIPVSLRDVVKRDTQTQTLAVQTPYEDELKVYIGFILDGVPDYRDLGKSLPQYKELTIYPNPKFVYFEDDDRTRIFRSYSEKTIDIQGEGFRLGKEQFEVHIGVGVCLLETLRVNLITCYPPARQPERRTATRDYPEVKVTVGHQRTEHHVGYLRYYHSPLDDPVIRNAVIIVCVCVLLLIVSIAVAVILVRRCRRPKKPPVPHAPIQLSGLEGLLKEGAESSVPPPYAFTMLDDVTKEIIQSCLLDRAHLKIIRTIGKGHFGRVEEGFYRQPNSDDTVHVAVKSLKGPRSNPDEILAFIKEATIMRDFKHKNVLGLVGVVCDQGEPLVVLPYMDYGDLKSYISNDKIELQLGELMLFARQVGEGMAYLANMRFVHRDLAARNCMINRELNVKIADFGLSRDIYETDYYKPTKGKTQAMPIRWMAVESMVDGRYSTQSDVWSYGIVLWELVTRGALPYPDLGNDQVKEYIVRGGRMMKPSAATPEMHQLMLDCWKTKKEDRPSFPDIVDRIDAILLGHEKQNENPDEYHDYLVPLP